MGSRRKRKGEKRKEWGGGIESSCLLPSFPSFFCMKVLPLTYSYFPFIWGCSQAMLRRPGTAPQDNQLIRQFILTCGLLISIAQFQRPHLVTLGGYLMSGIEFMLQFLETWPDRQAEGGGGTLAMSYRGNKLRYDLKKLLCHQPTSSSKAYGLNPIKRGRNWCLIRLANFSANSEKAGRETSETKEP